MKLLKYNFMYIIIILLFYTLFVKEGIFQPSGIKKLPEYNLNIYDKIEAQFDRSDIYGKMNIYESILTNNEDTRQKDFFLQDHFIDIYIYFKNNTNENNALEQYYFLLKKTINWYELNYSKLSNISPYIFLNNHRRSSLFQKIIIEENLNLKRYNKLKQLKDIYEISME